MDIKFNNKIIIPSIFIIGVGRSGTTLLMSMLNAHPDIVFPPETHFFRRYVVPNEKINVNKVQETLLSDKYLQRLSLDVSNVISSCSNKEQVDWSVAYQALLEKYCRKEQGKYVGDKDPKNIEYLPSLHNVFPDAIILHIIRDPRDVFLSRQKVDWSKDKHWFTHVMAYRIQYKLGRRNGKKYFGSNYYEIQYENLIAQPEKTLKRLCHKYLPVSYASDMLNFSAKAKKIIAREEKQWKKEAMGPILSNNSQKWEKNLSRNKIVIIETLCDRVFRDGFYKKAYPNLTLSEKLQLIPLIILAGIGENFYNLYLKYKQRAN